MGNPIQEPSNLVLRIEIASWEIGCCSPRPVVGGPLQGYRVVFVPADPLDRWDRAALDEDVDLDALPPQVVLPPGVGRGVEYGHFRAEWHLAPSDGDLYEAEPVSGRVLRTRVIVCDRRLDVPPGQREEMWVPVPGSLRVREVTGPHWDFDDAARARTLGAAS